MRCGSLLAILLSLTTVTVCFAGPRSFRDQALASTEAVRRVAPPPTLAAEYTSIMNTFSQAEELARQDRVDEAEKLYHLTLLKCSLYQEKVKDLAPPPTNGEQPPPSGAPAGDPPHDVPEHPPGTPPEVPGNGTPRKIPSPPDTAELGTDPSIGEEGDEGADNGPVSSRLMIGEKKVYTVRKQQSLRILGARLGVNWRTIARDNNLDPSQLLEPGQKLIINTRRIVPKTRAEGIVINIPDRTLYFFRDKKLEKAVPVGLGMPTNTRKVTWQTPTGKFRITSKVKDPTWFVPPSIQKEMKERGKTVQSVVPPGKTNPLGRYALKTSLSGILIHGTTRPASINTFSSHGCIRVHPAKIEEIFPHIRVNTGGEIIYQPVKVALSDDGRVFLEVHGDVYRRIKNLEDEAKGQIIRHNAENKVDWDKVRSSVRRKSGIPEDVTLTETEAAGRLGKKGIAVTTARH